MNPDILIFDRFNIPVFPKDPGYYEIDKYHIYVGLCAALPVTLAAVKVLVETPALCQHDFIENIKDMVATYQTDLIDFFSKRLNRGS